MADIEKRIVDIPIVDEETKEVVGILYPATIAEGVEYSNTKTTTVGLGGIKAGEQLGGTNLEHIVTKLLCPELDPVCELISSVPEGVYEKGTTQRATLTANLTANSSTDTLSNFSIHSKTASGDTEIINFGKNTIGDHVLDITEDIEFYVQVKVTSDDGTQRIVKGDSIKYVFVDPIYHAVLGGGDITAITSADPSVDLDVALVSKFTKRVIAKADTKISYDTGSNTTDPHIAFFVPSAWGALKVIDQNGFIITDSFKSVNVTINGVSGTLSYAGPVALHDFSITLLAEE